MANFSKMAKTNAEINDQKDLARALFLSSTLNQKQIAEKVGIAEKTMSKWVNDENWEKQKKSLTTSKQEQLAMLYDILAKLNKQAKDSLEDDDPETNPDSDGIIKIAAAIQKLEKEAGVGETIQCYIGLMRFVQKENIEEAKIVDKWFYMYIQDKLAKS